MKKHLKRLLACLYCRSDHLQKNGQLPKGGQRFRCTDCHKQFTLGGAR
ncbi:IS1 family transposase [Patescibacteria group bacterium]|nr:IS1 family transposase [Patescibacteria group bacterium]